MFTPDATAAAIVGIFVLGEATSPWLQAAYFPGSMARRIVVALALAVWCRQARIVGFRRRRARGSGSRRHCSSAAP